VFFPLRSAKRTDKSVVEPSQTLRSASTACPWKGAALCAAVYFAATPLSGWIAAAGLPVWLATGVALGALAWLGLAYWPAVLAAGWLSAIAMGYAPVVAAPFAITGLMEALVALALLSASRRAVNTLASAALIVVAVPAIGATFIAGLEGMSGDHSLAAFAIAWKTWWLRDAAGLLLSAPLWTLHPRAAIIEDRVHTNTSEDLLNFANAISVFGTTAPQVVSENRETPVRRTK
jgi:integral membrane sensor domain MASE1